MRIAKIQCAGAAALLATGLWAQTPAPQPPAQPDGKLTVTYYYLPG